MKRFLATTAAVFTAGALLLSGAAQAQSQDRSGSLPDARGALREAPARPAGRAIAAGPDVPTPMGWADFCAQPDTGSDCDVSALSAITPTLTAAQWRTVERVNRNVNAAVAPVSDADNYGVEERWTYPVNGRGDCEDYVLLKRRLLIEAGLPRQALLITVVREANGDGHAVLTLSTTRGDYVLDNKRDGLRLWNATGYSYIKRQSAEDPNRWVDLRQTSSRMVARR